MKISKKLLGFLIGAAILAVLLWHLDFRQIGDKLQNLDPILFFISIFWIIAGQFLGYAKWVLMKRKTLKDAPVPLLAIYSSVFVTGMVTPARTGDLLASFAWPAYQGRMLAWAILNRILEGSMTIVLALLVLGFFFTSALEGMRWGGLLLFSGFAVCGVILIFNRKWGIQFFEKVRQFLRQRESVGWARRFLKFEMHIEEQVKVFYDTLDEMKKAHALMALIFLTLLARVCTVVSNYFLLHSLGVFLNWPDLFGILAVTWVAGFFAPTPNGIGIGDLPPSLLLAHLGYQAYAGSFILMNRLLEAAVTFAWGLIGFRAGHLLKKSAEKRPYD